MREIYKPISKEFDEIKKQCIIFLVKNDFLSSKHASKFIDWLTICELQVFHHRFVQDLTLGKTGKALRITKERVRQVEAKSIRKFKRLNPVLPIISDTI